MTLPDHPPLVTPPTTPGLVGSNKPRSPWATVLGAVAIVFGALGALAGFWGVVGTIFAGVIMKMAPSTDETRVMLDVQARYMPLIIGQSVAGLVLGVLLLVSGIGLVRRHPRGVRLIRNWAFVKCLVVPLAAIVGYYVQYETMQQQTAAMNGSAGAPPPTLQAVQQGILVGTLVVNLAIGWALPLFVIFWTRRAAIRSEVSTWE